jgi:hypothetical protein
MTKIGLLEVQMILISVFAVIAVFEICRFISTK